MRIAPFWSQNENPTCWPGLWRTPRKEPGSGVKLPASTSGAGSRLPARRMRFVSTQWPRAEKWKPGSRWCMAPDTRVNAGTGRSTTDGIALVYFGNDWFAENRTSSHHIARWLAQRYPVLYVESPGLRAPQATARDFGKVWHKLRQAVRRPSRISDRMWHMTAPQIPFRRLPMVGIFNRMIARFLIRRAMRHAGIQAPLLWFAAPDGAALVGHLGEQFVVYYCIDDYASLPGVDRREIARMDESLARQAGQVFVSSPALVADKHALNPTTTYSPHGVDVALFERAADNSLPVAEGARGLQHPVIGFFGLVESWVDLDVLRYMAHQRPWWTFLVIGRVAVDRGDLARSRQFVFPGPQPYESLADWARAFDVAIIPFRQSQLVKCVNPLKLREYLATGKPVVSSWMPEVERFSSHIGIARTPEEFLAAIDDALA